MSSFTRKRLIVCCDGTWMNSESGYNKPTFWRKGSLQVPSNVTRISRCFRRKCTDGQTIQVIDYESGVGTGSNTIDSLAGGAFGLGISERIRQAYSFICANYCDGDDIILIGFSRGAFTARSVAGMIAKLGLLTRDGMDHFYPIFKDMENWMTPDYRDDFPTDPFDHKPRGPGAAAEYRARLAEMGYTRDRQDHGHGEPIKVKAVACWDTVGSLGIPQISWLNKLGIHASNQEYKFWDTNLSKSIEHAFQALALDETRYSFQPAVWERLESNEMTTDLRQVWFPGNHGNIGGGWADAGMANVTLAWMMDQLSSIGVEFIPHALDKCFDRARTYYDSLPQQRRKPHWALDPVYSANFPVRPWGLGGIFKASSFIYSLAGKKVRSPGLYHQVDPVTDETTDVFLRDTNERIHSSVRVRLACRGLGLDDSERWTCPALRGNWRLVRTKGSFSDPVPQNPTWAPAEGEQEDVEHPSESNSGRWAWEYCGPENEAPADPKMRTIVEEPLGPFERQLLKLSGGNPNVYQFAEAQDMA